MTSYDSNASYGKSHRKSEVNKLLERVRLNNVELKHSILNKLGINLESVSKRRVVYVGAKFSVIDYAMLQAIMDRRGLPNQSEAVREAVRVYFYLLSGVNKVHLGNLIIQNPIININEAKAEARAEASGTDSESVELLKERIKQLKEELKEAKSALNYYRNKLNDIKRQLQKLRLVLSKRDISTALAIINKLLR